MKSLHVRLAVVLSVVVAVLTLGLMGTGLWSAERYGAQVRQGLNREVAKHLVKSVRPFAGAEIDQKALSSLFMDVMVVNPSLEVYLLDTQGRILAFDAPEEHVLRRKVDLGPVDRFLEEPSERLIEGTDPRSESGIKPFSAAPVVVEGELLGYLYIIVGGEEFDSVAALWRGSHVARMFMIGALGLALLTGLVGLFAFAKLTRPLRALQAAVGSFREDRPHVPLRLRGQDEIAALGRTYDDLAERVVAGVQNLDQVDRERREFIANISHDLRTPLASLEGYLELLRNRPDMDFKQQREYLESATRGARQLGRLVDQLFELARLEAGDVPVSAEDFCPGELAQDIMHAYRPRAAKRGVKLVCRLTRSLPRVHADIGLIERALDNLVSNAIRHTPRGGGVEVSVLRKRNRVQLTVRDTGEGIAETDIERVFERSFHQSDGGTGTGLGLAITRRIVELHGARIDVKSALGEGATFRFALQAS